MSLLNRVAQIALSAVLALAATGCHTGLVDFTQELRTQHGLTKDDLKNLQYYVSHTVTLRRELESGGRQITGNHKLVLVAGKSIEEVEIEAKTPGIALSVGEGSMSIAFEPGSSLEFTAAGSGTSQDAAVMAPATLDPFPGNHPDRDQPLAPVTPLDSYAGAYGLAIGPSGTITFQGKAFEPVGDSLRAHLMIDAESLEEVVKKHKTLPGMRLPTR